MFYLDQFFKALKKSPIKGACFFISTLLLLLSLGELKTLEKAYLNNVAAKNSTTYFHALISSKENIQNIARKLRVLPGVSKAFTLSEEKIKVDVANLLGSFKEELTDELINLEFTGLKVLFSENIKVRSQQLIRDYLVRLVGSEKVTLGAIKKPDAIELKNAKTAVLFKKWGSTGVVACLFLIWAIFFYSFTAVVSKQAYLVEQFQRKKKVKVKILLAGLLTIFGIGLIPMAILGQPSEANILLFIAIMGLALLTQLRKSIWHS